MTNTTNRTRNRYHDRETWAAMPKPADYAPLASGLSDSWAPRRNRRSTRHAVPAPPVRPPYVAPVFGGPVGSALLALDVDGPLSPFAMARKQAMAAGFRDVEWRSRITYPRGSTWVPYSTLWLSRGVGDMLAEFSRSHDITLVWASLWEHNANAVVAPALGLPRLDYVGFTAHASRAWKWDAVAEFAAGRPLAWLDDGFRSAKKLAQRDASSWHLARRNLPTLCEYVDPGVGITRETLGHVADWLRTARLAWS